MAANLNNGNEMDWRSDLFDTTATFIGSDGSKFGPIEMETFKGGDNSGKANKYRPGNGTRQMIDLGSPPEIGDVTMTCLYTTKVNKQEQWLLKQSTKAEVRIKRQPLDLNGVPYGEALNYKGRLIKVTPPESDSQKDTPATMQFDVSALSFT